MRPFREDILQGIEVVHNSNLPGRIIVYGCNAEPVLTGHKVEDVIIAAATLGKGRIVVFSHDAFGMEFGNQEGCFENKPLYDNIKKWLLSKSNPSCKILRLDKAAQVCSMKELKDYDIVSSVACEERTSRDLIIQYIKEGGSFIHSATPWGWSMLNPNKDISEMPYLDILKEAGITYSLELSWKVDGNILTADNKAIHSHLGQCLVGESDFNAVVDKVGLISQIKEIPCLYDEAAKRKLEKYWMSAYDEVTRLASTGKIETSKTFEKKLLDFCLLGFELLKENTFRACGIQHFPGDFLSIPPLSSKEMSFHSSMEDYFFTSCYVPAGTEVRLNVSKIRNNWSVQVGAHTDVLVDDHVRRWPNISFKTVISSPGSYNLSCPFGGSVYFLSPKEVGSFIEASISNVVICPRFDLLNRSRSWNACRNDRGLWADISGKYLTITVPSSSVRHIDDPATTMEKYDNLLEAYHDLRGTDVNNERRMWIVIDIQPSVGYMHSGYPIVTHLDAGDPNDKAFLLHENGFDKEFFQDRWGIFHEIGHNMQRDEWTFEGTGEVTVNIFTLYGMETIFQRKPWIHPWLQDYFEAAVDYLNEGADFKKWKSDPGVALFLYAQLATSFGWATFKKVFRRYLDMDDEQLPRTDQDKIDTWFLIFSEEAKFNLASLALLWGIPISKKSLLKLKDFNYEFFIPKDEITERATSRVDEVRKILRIKH